MKTLIHTKTGVRLPEHGCNNVFSQKGNRWELFIRGIGWHSIKIGDYQIEEIPDLPTDYSNEQFIEYSKQYGVKCAQEFLSCCDYSKPQVAFDILHPVPVPDAETHNWFKATFARDLTEFTCGLSMSFGRWSIDIVRFDNYATLCLGYRMSEHGSLKDFLTTKYSAETSAKIEALIHFNKVEAPRISSKTLREWAVEQLEAYRQKVMAGDLTLTHADIYKRQQELKEMPYEKQVENFMERYKVAYEKALERERENS